MRNIFLYPIEAVNSLRMNVWAIGLIVAGSLLVLHSHPDVGGSLVTGGFALLRSEDLEESQPVANSQEHSPPDLR